MQFLKTPGAMKFALTGVMMALTLGPVLMGTAHAQEVEAFPSAPYRIKVGGYFPYDTGTKREIGGNFLAVGAGYDITRFRSFLPATLEGYVDYFNRIRSNSSERREARLFGIGASVRFDLDPNPVANRMYRPYAGAGVGIYTAHASRSLDGVSQDKDRTSLGAKFLAGTELRNGLFGEVEYDFVPHPSVFGNDVKLSGLQARLGFRFGGR